MARAAIRRVDIIIIVAKETAIIRRNKVLLETSSLKMEEIKNTSVINSHNHNNRTDVVEVAVEVDIKEVATTTEVMDTIITMKMAKGEAEVVVKEAEVAITNKKVGSKVSKSRLLTLLSST